MATSRPLAPEPELGSVLIVDDEAASRHLLGGYLAAVPCQVAEAVDGASALAAVAAAPPDLILLDVRMPGMNGLAVTRRLKTVPATATIPIMLVTALDDAADRLRGLEAGADDLSLSIRGPEGPIGVLGAYTARPRAFTADDIHFLQGIGQVLATAMDRTRAEADRAEILAQEQEVRRHLEEHNRALARAIEIGRASCRERV